MIIKSGNTSWDSYYQKVQQFIDQKYINDRDKRLAKLACLIASKNYNLIRYNSEEFKKIFSDLEIIEITWQISFYIDISIIKPISEVFNIEEFSPLAFNGKSLNDLLRIGNDFTQEHEIFREGLLGKPETTCFPEVIENLGNYLKSFLYSEIYLREKRDKAIVLISTLTVLSNAESQFSVHIRTCINLGLQKDEIAELVLCCLGLIDFPTVARKIKLLNEYFQNSFK